MLIRYGELRSVRADMVEVHESPEPYGIEKLHPSPALLALIEDLNSKRKGEHLDHNYRFSFRPVTFPENGGRLCTCRQCRSPMYTWRTGRQTLWLNLCSNECEAAEARDYQRRYRKTYDRPSRAKEPDQRQCAECGETFTAKRTDARYCSATCRQRAKRARLSEGA